MIDLRDKETGQVIGAVSEEQLQFLVDRMEEESVDDRDYYINADTLDLFEEEGIDPELLRMLKDALGSREDMEIVWARK